MMKKIFIALLMAVSTNFCLAADDELANDIKNKAIDIGFGAISGFYLEKVVKKLLKMRRNKLLMPLKKQPIKSLMR